jgi:hypothetical protein
MLKATWPALAILHQLAGEVVEYSTMDCSNLYSWNRPTGNAAGRYQFLIGGIFFPLVTSQTIKWKVTFLEKFGTGAPNTTGAYEPDLAEIKNFTAAGDPCMSRPTSFAPLACRRPDKAGR